MAKLEIPTVSKPEIVQEPVVQEAAIEEPMEEIPFTEEEVKAYSTPANWNINSSVEDPEYIEAANYSTGEIFEGTIDEFNTFLRG